MEKNSITDFIRYHYRHFNAAALVDAADAYVAHLDGGGQMLLAMAVMQVTLVALLIREGSSYGPQVASTALTQAHLKLTELLKGRHRQA